MFNDYRDYVFDTIQRTIGSPAPDWKAVLELMPRMNPPFGVNPRPGERQPLDDPRHGVTVMIDAGGHARGRIWLPSDEHTTDSNGNRWFTHEIQVIADGGAPGTFIWAWDSKGGAQPRPFSGTTVPPEPPSQPPGQPPSELVTQVEQNTKDIDHLKVIVQQHKAWLENLVVPAGQTAGRSLPMLGTHSHALLPQRVVDGRTVPPVRRQKARAKKAPAKRARSKK